MKPKRSWLKPQGGQVTRAIVEDVLLVIGEGHPDLNGMSQDNFDELYNWAIRSYLRASDNSHIRVPPRPTFLHKRSIKLRKLQGER